MIAKRRGLGDSAKLGWVLLRTLRAGQRQIQGASSRADCARPTRRTRPSASSRRRPALCRTVVGDNADGYLCGRPYHGSCGCSSATEVRVRVRHYGAGSVKAYTRSERTRFPAPDTTASTRARNRDQSALFWSNSVYTHRINGTIMCSLLHHNRSKPPKGLKVSPARSRWSVGTSPLSP